MTIRISRQEKGTKRVVKKDKEENLNDILITTHPTLMEVGWKFKLQIQVTHKRKTMYNPLMLPKFFESDSLVIGDRS